MKAICILLLSCLVSCKIKKKEAVSTIVVPVRDTIIKHDTIYIENSASENWQEGFGLTHDPEKDSVWGKPVKFYLNDPDCSPLAADFYYGQMRPSDNGATAELLKYAYTNNKKLRPLYRWCLNKTISVQDGALNEYTGLPARRYAEKFPAEFFEYMDEDTTGQKYKEWVNSILYSGFDSEDNLKKAADIRKDLTSTMKENCKGCSALMIKRIEKFTSDCFSKELE